MEEKTKILWRTAYAVLDAEGNWHTDNLGSYLSYDNRDDAIRAMERHGGAKVIRCRVYLDEEGETREATDVTSKQ